jgi:hypothetical protein
MMVAYAMELSVRFATEAFVPLVRLGRSSKGLWFLTLLLCVHGANAKPLKEHSRNETIYALECILMFCFCLQFAMVFVLHFAHLQAYLQILLRPQTEFVTRSGCSLMLR